MTENILSTAPLIEVSQLKKVYGKGVKSFEALKGLSFNINKGENVAIVGKSGSGKSTLMHLIALLDKPSEGFIKINGVNTTALKTKQINVLRNNIFGFVFQQFFLSPNETVLENVILPLKISGVKHSDRVKRGLEVLNLLDMGSKAGNKANDLSGGQKQRVVIARALANNPEIIFADEPTGNLDSKTGKIVEDILFSLNRDKNITLITVTHDNELADRFDRRIHVKDGVIVNDLKGNSK